jgi:signal transduction histidine kinase
MVDFSFPTFKSGIDKIKNNPQLVYTILVAFVITGAFVVMSERFIGIANSAQERLINVRIGSLQDAFVSFAGDNLYNTDYLNQKIRDVINNNETIEDFKVVEKRLVPQTGDTNAVIEYIVIASNNPSEIGKSNPEAEFLYSLAAVDPSNSLTIEFQKNGERFFNTARAIIDGSGSVGAVVMSTQTLSLADLAIEKSIANNTIILIFVLVFIMFLFLRHARIIDYTILYKKLKEVDQLKDDFVAMASHELRTPLTIIRGYVESINDAPDLSVKTKEYANKIDMSAKDLDSLVADILDVSRIEQGRMSFVMENIDPTDIVQGIVLSLQPQAEIKGLQISFDKSEIKNKAMIFADKDRLKQAMVNIVGNAIKYTIKGEIKVKEYIENNNLCFMVSDTGLGMSAEAREKLFEKFYRIKNKETEDIRGTGLGLWITAQIVKEMKGKISVESIKDVGSHFIISFPLVS